MQITKAKLEKTQDAFGGKNRLAIPRLQKIVS